MVTLPILLLLSYGIVLPPIVLGFMIKDIKVKAEGFLSWHLDSLGILIQRFLFAILCLVCILMFESCNENSTDFG